MPASTKSHAVFPSSFDHCVATGYPSLYPTHISNSPHPKKPRSVIVVSSNFLGLD
ncbi:MAG: hypothetical protein NZL83_00190 [Candidatus Absconditabacterales bacterium]|nr:hypothetical protein [Candidatus Absconditabacterales bacterium]